MRNFGYTVYPKLYVLVSRDRSENSYRKDTVLFERARGHLPMPGWLLLTWRLVMFLS
jgi:hypothetical protein